MRVTRPGFYVCNTGTPRILFSNNLGISGFFHPDDPRNWQLGMEPRSFESREAALAVCDNKEEHTIIWSAGFVRPSQAVGSMEGMQRYVVTFDLDTVPNAREYILRSIQRLLQGDPDLIKTLMLSPMPQRTIESVRVTLISKG